jgi:hypothetical protein
MVQRSGAYSGEDLGFLPADTRDETVGVGDYAEPRTERVNHESWKDTSMLGLLEAVRWLLERDADVNAQNGMLGNAL